MASVRNQNTCFSNSETQRPLTHKTSMRCALRRTLRWPLSLAASRQSCGFPPRAQLKDANRYAQRSPQPRCCIALFLFPLLFDFSVVVAQSHGEDERQACQLRHAPPTVECQVCRRCRGQGSPECGPFPRRRISGCPRPQRTADRECSIPAARTLSE